ncbi:MAG: GNAT family N-acetyltransferase [Candidatus Cyclobacteriaceae bacterium M2_1C_046]
MKIREIGKEDNPQIAAIIREVMTEFGASGEGFSIHDAEVDEMYENYTTPKAAYFVVEDNDKILGGGGIAPLEGGDEEICELKKMYFLPEVRGKGMGREIIIRCLEAARSLGYKQCYIETVSQMAAANVLYQKAGFKKIPGPMGSTGHFGCTSFYLIDL